MRKVALLVIAVGLVVVATISFLRGRDDKQPAGTSAGTASSGTSSSATSTSTPSTHASGSTPEKPTGVRRLDPDARRKLGEQIAAARAKARANAPAGAATEEYLKLEAIAVPVKEAMFQAIPILAECYKDRAPGTRTAVARMTLTSDPELGTVIDTDAIKDGSDAPLDPKLEECLRETIDTLGLPPLDSVGGKAQLQYSFRFDE